MVRHPLALLPVVTIAQGRSLLAPAGYGAATEYGTPALAIASWVDQGAEWVHVVDADAASGAGRVDPAHLVSSGVHLQYSGGVRDEESLAEALALDVAHVVLDPDDLDWACGAVAAHGVRVAVGLDIDQDALETAGALERSGCRRFVVGGVTEHHHRQLLASLCAASQVPVMVGGRISHLSDLHQLHELVPLGLDGILLDDALYGGAFTYAEAVAAGADRFDMWHWVPPFIG
jgi:phosphoribosylformimino-5-aminoimidazole carboxamide ribonucleotide (ProFAR) isomerase